MVRPKNSAVKSRANGALAANKQMKKRVPVLNATPYHVDKPDEDLFMIPHDKVAWKYNIEHRPPPPKGYFYADDFEATKRCMLKQKRERFKEPSDKAAVHSISKEEAADQDAVKFLTKLADNPALKARKLRSLAKSAGVELAP